MRDRPLRSITPQQSATALQQIGTGRAGLRWRRRGGAPVIVEALSVPVTFDDQRASLAVCRDMSDRVAVEREVLRSTERDRARLALELHEGVGQQLAGISLLLVSAKTCVASDPQRADTTLDGVNRLPAKSIARVRPLAGLSYPTAVEHDSLSLALIELTIRVREASEIQIGFTSEPGVDDNLDHAVATELFRIAEEALSNALRHASARTIHMMLARDACEITLSVTDDGVGLPSADCTPGNGVRSMRYRAGSIGAAITIARREPVGTRVEMRLPLADAAIGAMKPAAAFPARD